GDLWCSRSLLSLCCQYRRCRSAPRRLTVRPSIHRHQIPMRFRADRRLLRARPSGSTAALWTSATCAISTIRRTVCSEAAARRFMSTSGMAAAYVRKKASEQSRWGTHLTVQGGKDSEVFGFSATAPNLSGADWMPHVGLANVSYVARAGRGLTLQGGIFGSFIGYDSLYARDNFNYTRPWGVDITPYVIM